MVLYFLQTVCTVLPFVQGYTGESPAPNTYEFGSVSAFNMLVQTGGYSGENSIGYAIFGGLFVVLPIVAFFFCVLDKYSRIKYIPTALCSIVSAILICFYMPSMFALGAFITLILNVAGLFMTMQGFQATTIRINGDKKK